jgi:hypothetical protein
MSAPTGNFRGQRTQSSTSGYKTIGSSIASGSNGGCFKRIFINALGNTNGNYDLAFTKTLGIPRNYYNSTSNNSNYQEPTLSGKRLAVITDSSAVNLTTVYQTATVATPITYSYYMKKLDDLSCLTEVSITTPQNSIITAYEIDLTNFYTYLSVNITNLPTSTIALFLLPYNNINYFVLKSTTINNYLYIYVNTGQNYNSSYTNYLVLGVKQDQMVTNNGSINIYNNGFLTNYFYYTQPDNSISIQNQSIINLLPTSIWYKLGISNIQNGLVNGSVNGSYTSSLPTSPSPPW